MQEKREHEQRQEERLAQERRRVQNEKLVLIRRYEDATVQDRETMLLLVLPGRGYRVVPAPTPLPALLEALILPTEPEAVEQPTKTLEALSVTAIIGGVSTNTRAELREKDARYCRQHFPGHVVRSSLTEVLTRLGSAVLAAKLTELEKVASSRLTPKLADEAADRLRKESSPSSTLADRLIDGRYWMSTLADVAAVSETDDSVPAMPFMDFFPSPAEPLPTNKELGYNETRKYDAALRASAADSSTIFNIVLNIEYTRTKPPSLISNPLIGAGASVGKYQQAVANADDLLTFQSTRLGVPTLSFHDTTLLVSFLSPERFEFTAIEECFSHTNLPKVAALLHLLRTASLYQLGYNPLFIYSLASPHAHFSLYDIVPASVVLPGPRGPVKIRLTGNRLSQLRSAPFSRSTVVLEGELLDEFKGEQGEVDKEPTPVVVKLSCIDNARLWRERVVVDALYAADPQCSPAYAPELIPSFASAHGSSDIPQDQTKDKQEKLPPLVRRHLEAFAYKSPHGARNLKHVPAAEFLAAVGQLFEAILDAFTRRVLHRDVSVNNVLVAHGRLLLVDWEIGRIFGDSFASSQAQWTPCRRRASVASLHSRTTT
ncbi:hypothetical protein B0H17DRAFT_612382 [Mycena rosella]|uniref:Uncharacterized protein n=1 Tax=Mycena rosella TaxID=1033263 RepID=A0AAD7M932_MYCRO|nr:hypothetical protein B0H17DRAFT_612382 [Mycena rosella]